jgi:hypothetical protein
MNVSQRIAALGAPSILPTTQRTNARIAKIRAAVKSLYADGQAPTTIAVGECPAIVAQAMTALRGVGYSDTDAKAELSKSLVWGGNANLFRTWYMAARDDLGMVFSAATTMTPFFDALADVYCMFTFNDSAYVAWAPQSISLLDGNTIARFGDNDPQLVVAARTNPTTPATTTTAPADIVAIPTTTTATASAIAVASASALATASASISAAALAGSSIVSTVTSIAGTAADVEIVTQTTNANGAVATSVTSTAPLAAGETIQQRIARMLAAAQAAKAAI